MVGREGDGGEAAILLRRAKHAAAVARAGYPQLCARLAARLTALGGGGRGPQEGDDTAPARG